MKPALVILAALYTIALMSLTGGQFAFANELDDIQAQLRKACDSEQVKMIDSFYLLANQHGAVFSDFLTRLRSDEKRTLQKAAKVSLRLRDLGKQIDSLHEKFLKLQKDLAALGRTEEQDAAALQEMRALKAEISNLGEEQEQLRKENIELARYFSQTECAECAYRNKRFEKCVDSNAVKGCVGIWYDSTYDLQMRVYYEVKVEFAGYHYNLNLVAMATQDGFNFRPYFAGYLSDGVIQQLKEVITTTLFSTVPACKIVGSSLKDSDYQRSIPFVGFQSFSTGENK